MHSYNGCDFFVFEPTCEKEDNLLDHVNNIKVLGYQLVCFKSSMTYKNIVMNFLESLLVLYKYVFTTLKTMPMIELTMDYVTTHMMCMMLKHKEKKNPR